VRCANYVLLLVALSLHSVACSAVRQLCSPLVSCIVFAQRSVRCGNYVLILLVALSLHSTA